MSPTRKSASKAIVGAAEVADRLGYAIFAGTWSAVDIFIKALRADAAKHDVGLEVAIRDDARTCLEIDNLHPIVADLSNLIKVVEVRASAQWSDEPCICWVHSDGVASVAIDLDEPLLLFATKRK